MQFVSTDGAQTRPFYFTEHTDHPKGRTWQVVRSEFDQLLLERALAGGVKFFAETTDGFEKPGGRKKIEVARMPGYLRPFHFLAMFQYVREKAYETTDYRSYLQGKFNPQIKGGKEVPSW